MIADVESILKVCGIGTYLQVGCHNKPLIFELLKRSMDAYALDCSEEIVKEGLQQAPGRFFQGSLTNYPLNSAAFDTIIVGSELLTFTFTEMLSVLRAVRSIATKNLVLFFPAEQQSILESREEQRSRLYWEKLAISAGFRHHPRSMLVNSYESLEDERVGSLLFFECVPEEANKQYSLDWLKNKNHLQMDMLRESSRKADAHMARYVHAAHHIRPGDIVLDVACGMGDGSAILAACSSGVRFIGVDLNEDAIHYAQANFSATNSSLFYHICELENLTFLPDHSIDTVITFHTLESVKDMALFLKEVSRVLKPDGRLLASASQIEAKHCNVLNWDQLKSILEKYFIVDDRWAQTAGDHPKVEAKRRLLQHINLGYHGSLETEWWLVSACVDPTLNANISYTNPFVSTDAHPAHVHFAKYYDNPWLYRTMIQLGERLLDRQVLTDFCVKIVKKSRPGSADQGAALCVIAYQLLESGTLKLQDVTTVADFINQFEQAADKNNPHVYRWLISLHYVGGRLLLALGKREEALAALLHCAQMDVLPFSPLLATKTISARMYAGLIYTSAQQQEEAKKQFGLGVSEAQRVLQGDWKNIIGSLDNPLPFGLQEAAEIVELASQCAQALAALDRSKSVPGYFWDKINLKRFGLVEWNKDLERENAQLRYEAIRREQHQVENAI